MKNTFTYNNARGGRSLTPFAWSVIGIIAILALVTTFGVLNASATRSVVEATPQAITLATVTPALPTPTLKPATENGCPRDPSSWQFVDVSADSNYKRIEPTCVYTGLARTVAWLMLSSTYGYDIAEAGSLLGFGDNMSDTLPAPFHEVEKLVLRPFQGDELTAIQPLYPPMDRGLRLWEVGPDRTILSGTYMLQGCFRTYDVIGNEKQYIGDLYEEYLYEAVCQVSYDSQSRGWYIADYGDNIVYSDQLVAGRALFYFGYDASVSTWYFLGFSNQDIPAPDRNVLDAEYALMQEWYGAAVWDHAWLQSYNIDATPLPEGWESRNTSADLEALMERADSKTP